MSKTALITGTTGFIGSHLCRRLVHDEWKVHVIVRKSSHFDLLQEIKDKLCLHVYDGSVSCMESIMEEAKPTIIFHLASLFLSQHNPSDITNLIQSNITFGTQLVESAVQNECLQFINTGTSWQHYENEDYNPVNLYAATKQAFEDVLKYYVEAHGLRVITLKLFDTFGPDDPRPKLMGLLEKLAETGETLNMSPGEQLIDMVHIDDVVEAYCVAAERVQRLNNSVVENYGVGTGKPIKLKELVRRVEERLGKKINIYWGGRPYRKREVMTTWSQYFRIPGWFTQYNFLKDGYRKD